MRVTLMSDRKPGRASPITIRRFASSRDADRHDLEFWSKMSDDARVEYAWQVSEEIWRLRGDFPHESGLCRSVARLRRR
jgi:hypothetical protein